MIEITPYSPGVCADLHRIFFDTVRTINIRDYNQAQVEAWAPSDSDLSSWEARIESIKPYFATVNGEIAGFADLQVDGYIDMFFCRADMQGPKPFPLAQRDHREQKQFCLRLCHSL